MPVLPILPILPILHNITHQRFTNITQYFLDFSAIILPYFTMFLMFHNVVHFIVVIVQHQFADVCNIFDRLLERVVVYQSLTN